jgi:segregation and condensation protein B
MEMLEDAGLLSKEKLLAGEFPDPLPEDDEDRDDDEEAAGRTETG